jgi:F-type H+-transporting ATPase subunit delta
MAELITTARPYAEAAFSYAKEQGQLEKWSETLKNLALVASNAEMARLIATPRIDTGALIAMMDGVVGGLNAQEKNLLTALAENGRLNALPDLSKLFEQLKAVEDKRVKATVVSAMMPSEEQKSKLNAALNAKFDAEVDVEYEVDSTLLCGIRIKVGDWVVDNTAVTQLQKLGAAIAY